MAALYIDGSIFCTTAKIKIVYQPSHAHKHVIIIASFAPKLVSKKPEELVARPKFIKALFKNPLVEKNCLKKNEYATGDVMLGKMPNF